MAYYETNSTMLKPTPIGTYRSHSTSSESSSNSEGSSLGSAASSLFSFEDDENEAIETPPASPASEPHGYSDSYFPSSSLPNSPEFLASPTTFAYRSAARLHAEFNSSHVLVVDDLLEKKMQLQGMRDAEGKVVSSNATDVVYRHVKFNSGRREHNFSIYVFETGRFASVTDGKDRGSPPFGFASTSWSKTGKYLWFEQVLPVPNSPHDL